MKKIYLFISICCFAFINAFAQTCPTMTSSSSVTICSGASTSIALSADVASTFTWIAADNVNTTGESTTIQTTGTISDVLNNTSGSTQTVTYTVTPTATAGGCVGTAQIVSVTIIPPDDASFSYSASSFCKTGGSDPVPTITGVAGGAFSCTDAGLIINSATGFIDLATTPIGTYTVTYSVSGQCLSSSDFVISIVNIPAADFTFGTYCQNEVNPTPTYINNGSAGVFSSTPAGLIFVSTSIGEVNLTVSTPGTYTITNNIASGGGCPATAHTNTITINPVPVITVSNTTVCAGGTDTLQASGANTYVWDNGSTDAFIRRSPMATTLHTVTGTSNGCSSSAVGTIFVRTMPTASIQGTATLCHNSQTPNITFTGADGVAPYTFTYNISGGANQTISTTSGNNVTLAAATNTEGSFIFELISFLDSNSCSGVSVGTVTITINPIPVVTVNSPTICSGEIASLNALGADHYSWSNGATTQSINVNSTTTTTYTVSGRTIFGCANEALSNVSVLAPPCSPVSAPLAISVSSTDASNSSICDGTASATITGGLPPYSISLGNNTIVDSVMLINNLCQGFYTFNVTDEQSNSTSFTFVVGSPATTFTATNYIYTDSTVVDTIVTKAISNCTINYDAIDSITIFNYSFVGSDSIKIIWKIYQGNTSKNQEVTYEFFRKGVNTFVLDLFCANRSSGSAKGIDQLYINKSATGIETYATSQLSVYPNPFNKQLFVVVNKLSSIKIANLIGSQIYSGTINSGGVSIDVENFIAGVYFITISNSEDTITKKIIKN